MAFQDQFQQDLLHIVSPDNFGVAAQYIYVEDNTTDPVDGIFEKESLAVDPDTGASVITTAPIFSAPASQLRRLPKVGDRINIAGVVYTLSKPPNYDGRAMIVFNLHRGK